MADHTSIEWTDATWNPITGCSVVSPGCTNCYAMKLAGTRLRHHPSRAGLTRDSKAGPVWTGEVRLNSEWLDQPLRWKRPRRIFVCAHGDLFAEGVPDAWIDQVFAVMALAPQHTFQVLTKRAARMREYMSGFRSSIPFLGRMPLERIHLEAAAHMEGDGGFMDTLKRHGNIYSLYCSVPWPLPNVWLGVSAEDQARADERAAELLATPAAIRFVSAEPLLGPIDFIDIPWTKDHAVFPDTDDISDGRSALHLVAGSCLDWIIVGGESGPGARPMHPAWARSIRDQCAAAGTPFFFKQWGDWLPGQNEAYDGFGDQRKVAHWQDGGWGPRDASRPNANYVMWEPDGTIHLGHRREYFEVAAWAQRVGKHAAGRLLDGVEHNAMPEIREVPFR